MEIEITTQDNSATVQMRPEVTIRNHIVLHQDGCKVGSMAVTADFSELPWEHHSLVFQVLVGQGVTLILPSKIQKLETVKAKPPQTFWGRLLKFFGAKGATDSNAVEAADTE